MGYGLNIRSLRQKNHALIGKWWWRFWLEKDALWSKVIRSIHDRDWGLGVGNSYVESRSGILVDIIKVGCDTIKRGWISLPLSLARLVPGNVNHFGVIDGLDKAS